MALPEKSRMTPNFRAGAGLFGQVLARSQGKLHAGAFHGTPRALFFVYTGCQYRPLCPYTNPMARNKILAFCDELGVMAVAYHVLLGVAVILGTWILANVAHRLLPDLADDIKTMEHTVIMSALWLTSGRFLLELLIVGVRGLIKAAKGNHNVIVFGLSF